MAVPDTQPRLIRFEDFELDTRAGELRKAGVKLKLTGQPLLLLAALLERPGDVVTRDELQKLLWPDTFVDVDHNLNTAINKIREALGDSADSPRYVETIPRRGYRFIGVLEAPVPPVIPIEPIRVATSDPKSVKGSWHLVFAGIGLALLAILMVGFLLRGILRERAAHAVPSPFAGAKSTGVRSVPLTSVRGYVSDPAFSPDGEKIAFFWDGETAVRSDLYVQLVGGEKPLKLTHTASGYLCCANWSPDGRQIAFTRCDDSGGAVYVVPALGGSERKITDVACLLGYDGYPTWTLDGAALLLADRCVPNGPRGIVVFSLSTGEKRCLTAPPPLGDSGDIALALSPDGKTLAFIRSSTIARDEIYTIELSGSHLRQLTHDDNSIENHLMWAPDGQHIIFISSRGGDGRPWRVSAVDGSIEQEPVFPGVGTLSRDGRRLAYVEYSGLPPAIWRARLDRPGGKVLSLDRIIASSSGDNSMQLSSDNRQIVFRSGRSGTGELWKSDANGNDLLKLTTTLRGYAGTPRWSPDGKWIAFDYRINSHSQIFMIDAEGRNQHAVTAGDWENEVPSWSRDGASVYFASNRTGSWQVWRRRVASGEETQVTRNGGHASFESYDAKMLYYAKFDGAGIWSIPMAGGSEQRVIGALHRGYWGHFAVTEEGIYLRRITAPNSVVLQLPHEAPDAGLPIHGAPYRLESKLRCVTRWTHGIVCANGPAKFHHDGGKPPVSTSDILMANSLQ